MDNEPVFIVTLLNLALKQQGVQVLLRCHSNNQASINIIHVNANNQASLGSIWYYRDLAKLRCYSSIAGRTRVLYLAQHDCIEQIIDCFQITCLRTTDGS